MHGIGGWRCKDGGRNAPDPLRYLPHRTVSRRAKGRCIRMRRERGSVGDCATNTAHRSKFRSKEMKRLGRQKDADLLQYWSDQPGYILSNADKMYSDRTAKGTQSDRDWARVGK